MSRNTQLFALIVALAVTPLAYAGDADICYGPSFSALDSAHPALDDSTIFKCGHAGAHTLPDLAKDGWIVVQITPVMLPRLAKSSLPFASGSASMPSAERLIIRK
jgi:hypothetical protein